ncbi:MAG: hypothetical protein JWM33_3452, partial [Caulobacteraceae bacterium]|nr:hypothetical protein [Caulobacteraceae bacterium]
MDIRGLSKTDRGEDIPGMRLLRTIKELDLSHIAVMGSMVAALVTFTFDHDVFNDGDTYWHLATGRWILEHGRVPLTDPFSHTMGGQPWQAHEWLADIFMYGSYQLGGWSGLTLFFGLVTALGAGLLAARVSRSLGGITLVCTLALALASTSQSLLIRPHALMLPLLIFWTIQIMDAREKEKAPPLALAALMVVWANLHASYVFGFVVAGAFGLEALWEAPKERRLIVLRDWALFGALSLVAICLTPFGIPGVIFPFKVLSFSFLNDINEWKQADFSNLSAFQISLLVAVLVCLARGVQVKPMRALLLVTLLQMALQHRRQVIVLVLLAPLLLAEPLARALKQPPREARKPVDWRPPAIAFALLAVLIGGLRLATPFNRGDERVTPYSALRHVPKAVQAMPVLNDYSMGGYLTFMGVRPYIDGRADMYGDPFVSDFMKLIHAAEPTHLQRVLDKYKIAWTIFSKDDVMVAGMDQRPGWHRLYADGTAVVHVRNDIIPPLPQALAKPAVIA